MARDRLRLVTGGEGRPGAGWPGWAACLAAMAALVAATVLGADLARRMPEADEVATAAVRSSWELGSSDPTVSAELRRLRAHLARHPLDGRARSSYAAALLALAPTLDVRPAAAFHARKAAEAAPVTVPVVQRAILVLHGCGEKDEALAWCSRLFGYAPGAGARVLSRLEAGLSPDERARAVGPTSAAALAWGRRLLSERRPEQAERWFRAAVQRDPGSVEARVALAGRLASRRDWDALLELLDGATATADVHGAILHVYRARALAGTGAKERADSELARGLDLAPEASTVLLLAADARLEMGQPERSRDLLRRALHRSPVERDGGARRRAILVRLGRLEEELGNPVEALRVWRELLELDPENAEARRRIEALVGFTPDAGS